jgi:PKD repeat protein
MSNRKDIVRIILSVLLCMIILSVTTVMVSTRAEEVLPTVMIRIHRIQKVDDIEGFTEGGADWHYYILVWAEEKYLSVDKICTSNRDDTGNIGETYTFEVKTRTIWIEIYLLEEDFWSAQDVADISGHPGGGYDDYDGTIPRGAKYFGVYDLKNDILSEDEVTELGSMWVDGFYNVLETSGDYDDSTGVDENDAVLWFSIQDNYGPPVVEAMIGLDHPIYKRARARTGDIVIFDGSRSLNSPGSSITKFEWDFESDGLMDAEGVQTSFTYNKKGNYTATLKVTDNLGETYTDTCTIEVLNRLPTPNFTYTPSAPTIQNETRFYDASEDKDGTINSWFWDFGDGATSTEKDPTHQYPDKGNYNVQLKVTDNDGGSNNVTISVTIYNIAPSSDFTFSPNTPETGENVEFTDTSSDPESKLSSWSWSFGDGSSSTEQNPTHTYQKNGIYTVTLTAQDDEGVTSTKSKKITVTIPRGIIGGPGWIDDIVVFGAVIAAVVGFSGIVVRSRKLKKKA